MEGHGKKTQKTGGRGGYSSVCNFDHQGQIYHTIASLKYIDFEISQAIVPCKQQMLKVGTMTTVTTESPLSKSNNLKKDQASQTSKPHTASVKLRTISKS